LNGKIPGTDKPKLLLHCCCAPCSSATLERIQREYETDIYYYNPNIEPEAEFRKRAAEEERFVSEFRPDGGVKVIVDYAHNGLSFEKVFDYADRFHPKSRKIVVYGCPGNKALDRREEMSDVAGRRADFVILTDDDPADEESSDIMDRAQVMLVRHGVPFLRIPHRPQAIAHALSLCRPGDLLLLLGKGHETGQTVRGENVYYGGDRLCAEQAFAALPQTV